MTDVYFMQQALREAAYAFDEGEVPIGAVVVCAGALAWAHIGRVVFGAYDDKRGFGRFAPKALHPKTELVGGVMAQECGEILQRFFSAKR